MALACGLAAAVAASPAGAITIEMDDVAPDRVERQRAFAEGALPLPHTPSLAHFTERLAAKGLKVGDQVFIRIFKSESQLELWMRKGDAFVLFATYPICSWSGTLGPKQKEGDRQNPEGFYSISRRQLHWSGRWPRALDLGYPNTFDRAHNRTGSYLLVHGGCSSVGCYAMTNAVMAEIFQLSEQALKQGQPKVEVHVFPFRMTEANMQQNAHSPWADFWATLRAGYDSFEASRLPPRVGICDKQYIVEPATAGEVETVQPVRTSRRASRRSRWAELPTICKPASDVAVASVPATATSAVPAAANGRGGSIAAANATTTNVPDVGGEAYDTETETLPDVAEGQAPAVDGQVLGAAASTAVATAAAAPPPPVAAASFAAGAAARAAAPDDAVDEDDEPRRAVVVKGKNPAMPSKPRRRRGSVANSTGAAAIDPAAVFGEVVTR